VGYTLLGSDEGEDLRLWVEVDFEGLLIPLGNGSPELDLPLVGGVLVVSWVCGRPA